MTQEDKELLLKDLCARIPYRVKILDTTYKKFGASDLINIGIDGSMLVDNIIEDIQYYPIINNVKPYLRSMSSMTDEEEKEYKHTCSDWYETLETYDWLNAHHFDYRGLIEKGLALEAPKDMYNIK